VLLCCRFRSPYIVARPKISNNVAGKMFLLLSSDDRGLAC
jgi:hypothetical protein